MVPLAAFGARTRREGPAAAPQRLAAPALTKSGGLFGSLVVARSDGRLVSLVRLSIHAAAAAVPAPLFSFLAVLCVCCGRWAAGISLESLPRKLGRSSRRQRVAGRGESQQNQCHRHAVYLREETLNLMFMG